MFMQNLYYISLGSKEYKNLDGFPLSLTLFHVIKESLNIIAFQINRKDFFMKSARRIFNDVCISHFSNNIYSCLNEFIFHFMNIFVYSWHCGMDNLKYKLGQCLEYNTNLYKLLYTVQITKKNHHKIDHLNFIITESFQLAVLFF